MIVHGYYLLRNVTPIWVVSLASLLSACRHSDEANMQCYEDTVASVAASHDCLDLKDTVRAATGADAIVLTPMTDTADATDVFRIRKRPQQVYSAAQLYGHWVLGTRHECYYPDSTGRTWDTEDDVSEDEVQCFRWTLVDNQLMIEYQMRLGGVVPRDYIVTYVDDETLVYKDLYGAAYMWDKYIR